MFSIYSFASVAASPVLGRMVQLGYIKRRSLLLAGLLVVLHLIEHLFIFLLACQNKSVRSSCCMQVDHLKTAWVLKESLLLFLSGG